MYSRKSLVCLIPIVALASIVATQSVPTCLDDDGKPVDWYIVYKMPLLQSDGAPFNTGYGYAYITSDQVKELDPTSWTSPEKADLDSIVFLNRFRALLLKYLRPNKKPYRVSKENSSKRQKSNTLLWTIPDKLITNPKSLVLRTLQATYEKGNKAFNSIFYNDAPPGLPKKGSKRNSAKAHAKGAVVIEENSGDSIWLTHSVSIHEESVLFPR